MSPYQILTYSLYANFFMTLIIGIILLYLKEEGRYHLKRSLSKGGLDLITLGPEGRILNTRTIKWTGDFFQNQNEAIFHSFDPLLEDDPKFNKDYNELIRQASHWKGSKRPVVFGSEVVSMVSNPSLLTAIEASKDKEQYEKVKPVLETLKSVLGEKIVKVSFIQPFKPDTIRDYLNSGSTPTKNLMTYEKGKLSGIFQMTRKRDLGKIVKYAVPIGMILLLLLLWNQGAFDNVISSISPK